MTGEPSQSAGPRDFLLDMLPRGSVGAEIGVHVGEFSQQILQAVRPRQLHLIDPWKHEASETYRNAWYGGRVQDGQAGMDTRYRDVLLRFAPQIQAQQVVVHRGTSADVLTQFQADFLDWVYIDGNHLYEYVRLDLALSLQRVKRGGYITGDDYVDGGWWQGGAKKAVDEFATTAPVELVSVQNRQFVFRKV